MDAGPTNAGPLKRKDFYGWWMVAITALVLLATAGARSAPGVFLLDMQHDTGYSKATLSFATALGLVLFGLGGPLAGGLMNRLGIRTVSLASLSLTALALFLSSKLHSTLELNLFFGLLLGFGTGLVASVLGATVASRWFVEKRGLVTGIFGASTSAGQMIFVSLLTTLVSGLGWRQSAIYLAVVSVALLLPTFLLMRESPEQLQQLPLGATDAEPVAKLNNEAGVMRRAIGHLDFWLLAITFYICGATSNGLIGQHFIAHATDHGFSVKVAGDAMVLMGAFNFIGTIASGWLTDRYDPRRLLLVYYFFRGISLLFLPWLHNNLDIVAFSILFGLDYIATVPPTIALCANMFGRRNVGVVYGWVFAAHQLGAAVAAYAGGLVRDRVGDYAPAFVVAGIIAVIGGFMALSIGRKTVAPNLLAP